MQVEAFNVEEADGTADVCVEVVEGTIVSNARVNLNSRGISATGK